jgi:DNA polymerase
VDQPLGKENSKPIKSLRALAETESDCRRCPLYRHATRAVPGEGPKDRRA